MYEPPIELLITDIQHQIVKQQDEKIYEATVHFVPNVKKDELIRALQYDRNQYEKGYADGKHDVMAGLVLCEDCRQWRRNVGVADSPNGHCFCHDIEMNGYDFCSYGERRDDG